MFMFGVGVMQIAAEELAKPDHELNPNLVMYFYGSLPRTVFTLYCTISGGIDWNDTVEPLITISPAIALFFSVYIAFAVFCVLNIVTGVFVENATKIIRSK